MPTAEAPSVAAAVSYGAILDVKDKNSLYATRMKLAETSSVWQLWCDRGSRRDSVICVGWGARGQHVQQRWGIARADISFIPWTSSLQGKQSLRHRVPVDFSLPYGRLPHMACQYCLRCSAAVLVGNLNASCLPFCMRRSPRTLYARSSDTAGFWSRRGDREIVERGVALDLGCFSCLKLRAAR